MPAPQEQYDDAMFAFSTGDYDAAITRLQALLAEVPDHFDAQLSLGMAYYRKGDYVAAIGEGHKAEKLRPKDQLVHTNLSLFYMTAGDKKTAEREIFLKGELEKAAAKDDFEAYQQLEKQLASDRRSLQAELEEKKEKVRQAKPNRE